VIWFEARFDGLSIGSNDLTHLTPEELAKLFDVRRAR
jgi:hypothetical protein